MNLNYLHIAQGDVDSAKRSAGDRPRSALRPRYAGGADSYTRASAIRPSEPWQLLVTRAWRAPAKTTLKQPPRLLPRQRPAEYLALPAQARSRNAFEQMRIRPRAAGCL